MRDATLIIDHGLLLGYLGLPEDTDIIDAANVNEAGILKLRIVHNDLKESGSGSPIIWPEVARKVGQPPVFVSWNQK